MAASYPPPTVLLAEDDHLERSTVADALAAMGLRVRAARDGAEALDIATTEPVDLVLADLDLPHLDGMTLCRVLASWPRTRDVPRLVASGALSAWEPTPPCADAFLPKPFSLEELEAAITRALSHP